MFKISERIIIILILLIISTAVMSFETIIGENIADLVVNPINGNIAVPTSSELLNFSKIEIADSNLNRFITLDLNLWDYPYFGSYSQDGSKLYFCIANMPNWENTDIETEDGKLLMINTTSWQMTYYNLPNYPMKLYVPIQNNIVYLTCGYNNGPMLIKFDTSNGQILNSVNEYTKPMFECGGICMDQSETKIYIDAGTNSSYGVNEEPIRYSKLFIYDSDLNYIGKKELAPEITDIISSTNNKIYISHSENSWGNDKLITVLDTITDEISYEFVKPNTGAGDLELDPAKNFLYLSIATLQEYYNETVGKNLKTLLPTNSVMRIDLSDWSYSMIQVANETIGPIALSPDGCRLYAAAVNTDSQKVYYVDLE